MTTIKRISVWVSLIIMLTFNALAVLLPLNNKTTKELSDAIITFFVPSGYVFSIWSLIYLALIGYAIYQSLPRNRTNHVLHSIAWLFVVNALANAGWIILWHYEHVGWSVLVMLVILATLLAMYVQSGVGRQRVKGLSYWLWHFPLSLYLGWISVATIANISAALTVYQWNRWGIAPEMWSATMLIVAMGLTLAMLFLRRDTVFACVIIWAVIGIALKFSDVALIAYTGWVSVVVIALTMLWVSIRHHKRLA